MDWLVIHVEQIKVFTAAPESVPRARSTHSERRNGSALMVLSVTRGWREHSTGKANGREAGDGHAASDRGLAWAAGLEYDLPTNSGAELQVSRMRRSCAGIQRVKQLCRQQRVWRVGRWRARAQRYGVERDEAGEETTDPAGPGGFQTWDMDQDFKQGVFCLPRGDGMGWVGGGRGQLLLFRLQDGP